METSQTGEILNGLRIIVQALRVSSRAAEKMSGLSGAQLFVLERLREAPEMSLSSLADSTHTHQSSVSVVVGKLVRRGLVRRSRSKIDGRQLVLDLTTLGLKKLDRAPETAQDKLLRGLEKMRANERSQLASMLTKMISLAGFNDQTPNLFFEEQKKRAVKAN